MKLNELVKGFEIYTTNEEKSLLDKLEKPCYIEFFTEREQIVLDNLVRKSLVSKVNYKGALVVVGHEHS